MVRGSIYRFDSFSLDVGARHLLHRGKVVHLTPKEFDLLALLVQNAGRVVSKDEIFSSVWHNAAVEEGNLTQTICLLRKVLGAECIREPIETVPRHGYLFNAKVMMEEEERVREGVGRLRWVYRLVALGLFLALWAVVFYRLGAGD